MDDSGTLVEMAKIDEVRARLVAEPQTWLVSGVAGFIGSHLLQALLELDQTVVGLDNFSTGTRDNLAVVQSIVGTDRWARFRLVTGDVCDPSVCDEVVRGVDHVLHQAALGSVPRSIRDPWATHQSNVDGFVKLALAARDAKCRSFVYASSSSVYGDSPAHPRRENSMGRPLSPYAASKQCNESCAHAYAAVYDLSFIGLRYFNVVGPRQDPAGPYSAVVPRWIANFLEGERPVVFGDGTTTRDFCPVDNVVQANLLAATASRPQSSVYNVALGRETSLNELFAALRKEVAAYCPTALNLEPRYAPFRAGDVRYSRADISCARQELQYQPEMDLEAGLARTVAWQAHRG